MVEETPACRKLLAGSLLYLVLMMKPRLLLKDYVTTLLVCPENRKSPI